MGTLGWRKGTLEERLLSKLDKNGPIPANRPELGPCWIWTGCVNDRGYGQIAVTIDVGVVIRRYTHIVSYEIYVGSIHEGLELDHLCRITRCANPAHLEPVTHRENLLRGVGPAAIHAAKTHCDNGHEFTEGNIYYRPDNWSRQCCICNRERSVEGSRLYRERHPEKRKAVLENYGAKLLQEKIASGLSWSGFRKFRTTLLDGLKPQQYREAPVATAPESTGGPAK